MNLPIKEITDADCIWNFKFKIVRYKPSQMAVTAFKEYPSKQSHL